MTYRELVKQVQHYSGFSARESEKALKLFVRKLAARLTIDERKDLASQLPRGLHKVAMTDESTDVSTATDFIQQICEEGNVGESRAKRQSMSAWLALKDAVSKGEIEDIKAQLPRDLASQLY